MNGAAIIPALFLVVEEKASTYRIIPCAYQAKEIKTSKFIYACLNKRGKDQKQLRRHTERV